MEPVDDYRSRVDRWGDTYDIRRDGHAITGGAERSLTVPKLEMTAGKLFNTNADRLHVLALMLESVGIDAAIRLAPLHLWKQALADWERENAQPQTAR